MLAMALFEMPDAFYNALRLVVTAAAIMEIFQTQKSAWAQGKKTAWTLAFAAIAIVFNPILPLEMDRETWAWFDVAAIIVFLFGEFSESAVCRVKAILSDARVISSMKSLFVMAVLFGLFLLVFIVMGNAPRREKRGFWQGKATENFLKIEPIYIQK